MIFGESFFFGATTLHVIRMPLPSLVFRVSFSIPITSAIEGYIYGIREDGGTKGPTLLEIYISLVSCTILENLISVVIFYTV